jgi:hypothetical protein
MGTRGNTKEGKAEERWLAGWMDGWMELTNRRLTEEDIRDMGMRRKLVLGEGKQLYSG